MQPARHERTARLLKQVIAVLDGQPVSPRERGVATLKPDLRIEYASAAAARGLRALFGEEFRDHGPVPASLRAWLRSQSGKRAGGAAWCGPAKPGADTVWVRVALRTRERIVVVVETGAGSDGRAVRPLTPRERDVLAWVAQGKSNPEAAVILGMARRTVEKHMENILAKLGVENRAGALLAAVELGLVARDRP